MSGTVQRGLQPRKRPVQQRSQATVSALLEASLQVLQTAGYRRLTTTRVADRAGVSVGTLYQYFPNKAALVAFIVEQHLTAIVNAVVAACRDVRGQDLPVVVDALVDAFLAAKLQRVEATLALYAASGDAKTASVLRTALQRAAAEVGAVLACCPDVRFADPVATAANVVASCSALAQSALERGTSPDVEALRRHMKALVLGYLTHLSTAKPS